MVRKSWFFTPGLFLFLIFSLSGCPKRPPEPVIIEKLPVENPIAKILKAFSAADSLQAKASIRIDMTRSGQEMNFALNGVILYQKPDQLRILGYHPFGMGVFDALYKNGEFFLLSPLQKRAYTGEISEFDDLMEKAGVQVTMERAAGGQIPNRIRIELTEKETRVDLRLKEISLNPFLPEDTFWWVVPEGVEVRPLAQFLKVKRRK
jgi:outer membrane lipoprotein-sorting protein